MAELVGEHGLDLLAPEAGGQRVVEDDPARPAQADDGRVGGAALARLRPPPHTETDGHAGAPGQRQQRGRELGIGQRREPVRRAARSGRGRAPPARCRRRRTRRRRAATTTAWRRAIHRSPARRRARAPRRARRPWRDRPATRRASGGGARSVGAARSRAPSAAGTPGTDWPAPTPAATRATRPHHAPVTVAAARRQRGGGSAAQDRQQIDDTEGEAGEAEPELKAMVPLGVGRRGHGGIVPGPVSFDCAARPVAAYSASVALYTRRSGHVDGGPGDALALVAQVATAQDRLDASWPPSTGRRRHPRPRRPVSIAWRSSRNGPETLRAERASTKLGWGDLFVSRTGSPPWRPPDREGFRGPPDRCALERDRGGGRRSVRPPGWRRRQRVARRRASERAPADAGGSAPAKTPPAQAAEPPKSSRRWRHLVSASSGTRVVGDRTRDELRDRMIRGGGSR